MGAFWSTVKIDLVALGPTKKDQAMNLIFSGSFHLILLHRISAIVHTRISRFGGQRFADLIRCIYTCDISPGAKIGAGTIFIHPFCVVIGEGANIGHGCKIYNGTTIGNRKGDNTNGMATIGNDVLIGTGAKILGAVTIGDHAKIGANSVVLMNVPAGATAVGVPAAIINT